MFILPNINFVILNSRVVVVADCGLAMVIVYASAATVAEAKHHIRKEFESTTSISLLPKAEEEAPIF